MRGLLCLAAFLALGGWGLPDDEAPPAEFRRYLPRGRIPSLDAPRFVSADKARIPADAWVLGVVKGREAKAYDLNLMTRTEVINDYLGDEPIAAVYCPLANTALVYDRRIGDRELRFEPSGVLMGGAIVMQDKETDSFWPILQGQAAYGPLKGQALEGLPLGDKVRWKDWVREHPDTLVLSVQGQEHMETNPMEPYLTSPYGYRGLAATDERLKTKDPVFGFELGGRHYAAPAKALEGGRVFSVAGRSVFLHRPVGAELNDTTHAFVSDTGFRRQGETWAEEKGGARFDAVKGVFAGAPGPKRLEGFDTFWYVWSLNHPDTELLGP